MTTPSTREETRTVSSWCPDCKRMKGVGCACGMTFAEKIRSASTVLPASFRAVKG